uniref:Uncharacterized protein n=1 Tax=Aegilops tauschii subsp. strangulata TaxID=200361 RepID=A0A453B5E3_AEGTS
NIDVACACLCLFSLVPAEKMVQGSRHCLRFGRPCHFTWTTRTIVCGR